MQFLKCLIKFISQVSTNVFICDPCCFKLKDALSFKERCIQTYTSIFKNIKVESFPTNCVNNLVYEEEEHLEDEEHLEGNLIELRGEDPSQNENIISADYDNEQEEEEIEKYHNNRNRYTLKEKLNAIKVAEAFGNRKAEKLLNIDESCIRKWRNQKEKLQSQEDLDVNTVEYNVSTSPLNNLMKISDKKEIKSRKSYTTSQKLEIVSFAETSTNRKTAKIYNIDESCIRKWRNQKEMLESINKERCTRRKPNLRFPQLENRLKQFVQQRMDYQNGFFLRPHEIRAESIKIAKDLNISNFKGTSSYIFKFMERYNIPSSRNKYLKKSEEFI